MPRWSGELYLEFHRGTYTTMAINKKYNRLCEFLYQNTEAAYIAAGVLLGCEYPQQVLHDSWKIILLNQFHDILTGSSIKEVYDTSLCEYEQLVSRGTNLLNTAKETLEKQVKSNGGLIVFNPNSFAYSAPVAHEDTFVFAENIPAKGYKVIQVKETKSKVKLEKNVMENDFLQLKFDKAYQLVSIYDKKIGREILQKGKKGNVLFYMQPNGRKYLPSKYKRQQNQT